MKSLLVCLFALTLGIFSTLAAKPAHAYELKNVIISSVRSREVGQGQNKTTVTELTVKSQDNKTFTVIVTAKTKFTKVVNGKRKPIPAAEGRQGLVQGAHIGVNGKETQKGIIAVLIGL